MATPLCPDCKKQMTIRYICTHCGYDEQRVRIASLREAKAVPLPYICAKCGKPAGKLLKGIPVCGDCFVAGWGRLDEMPLTKGESGTVPLDTSTEAVDTVGYKCPNCRRNFTTKTGLGIHKQSKHGGK